MSTYDCIMKTLTNGGYTFMTSFDNAINTKEICVKTEDERITLIYKFDEYGIFKTMYYCHSKFDYLLQTMLECNIMTGQFLYINAYYGINKAKKGDEL